MLTPQEWHARFSTQAGWTEAVRRYLTADLSLDPGSNILDIGCGTGALLPFFEKAYPAACLVGLDLNRAFLNLASAETTAKLIQGDAYWLPFPNGSFSLVYCHYFLLWLQSKDKVLREISRVLQPGGVVLVLAEPDYGGRIDYPELLGALGYLQTQSLIEQGIDPAAGRKLADLLLAAGFDQVTSGVIGSEWNHQPGAHERASEWQVLSADLQNRISAAELAEFQRVDEQAWLEGRRILFVPTFFGRGEKPGGSWAFE